MNKYQNLNQQYINVNIFGELHVIIGKTKIYT
jgi:hypothetical protein